MGLINGGALSTPAAGENQLSCVFLMGYNGVGSRSTFSLRFKTQVDVQGTAINYIDSVEDGAQMRINETGLYFINLWGRASNGSLNPQILLNWGINAGSPTSGYVEQPLGLPRQRMILATCAMSTTAGQAPGMSLPICVPLREGDVISFSLEGGDSTTLYMGCSIARVK